MMGMVVLAVAAFCAGGLNAVAGGGTFLTFPALVMIGVPPIPANATSAIGVLPGYLSSAVSFRRDIGPVRGIGVPGLVAIGLVGGLGGALLLLVTPADAFSRLVPWLLLAATALFAAGPRLTRWLRGRGAEGRLSAALGLLAVSVYGGYFNGGLGILLLALFSLLGLTDINTMNGLKNVLSAVLAAIASVAFAVAGIVSWPEAGVIMVASTIGGYVGGTLSRRIPAPWLRAGIVAIGLVMSAIFFVKS
ncbi:sulfite exporter TauE/SafE family protein [Novispirillum sp. DQ9]|uniref:sulfite exporter TauE/SafE family protein n=1 Tax=Novispirillum sp. DQ9 TaxID=3398612 RepID=UPI003C7B8F95